MKLYYPPAALLPQANRNYVELAGAKCIIAIDEERQFHVISNVFSEISWGEFWKEVAISDQIEKITVKQEDSDAIYDPQKLAERIIGAFNKIMDQKMILFGVACFEGNAFETVVFDEMEFSREDSDKIMNLYKASRVVNAFPNIKKGKFCEVNFFGESSTYFSLPNKKNLRDIAQMIQAYEGNASGIVAVAQGAANFIILTENISKTVIEHETRVDKKNLNQMFHLLKKGILAAPISWFKIHLGLQGLETLENWEEIRDMPEIREIRGKYFEYLQKVLTQTENKSVEYILAEDLGTPIDLRSMKDDEIQSDLDNIMSALNELDVMGTTDEAISLLYYPPKVLFSYGDKKGASIGGAMALLSIDVGKNIHCIGDLRHYLAWGEYYQDLDSKEIDSFDEFQEKSFFELENPTQLRDIYVLALQNIMKNSQLLLGLLELENNAFEFSLFPELEINNEDLKIIQNFYRVKRMSGKFPKLKDGHIQISWYGNDKDYLTNSDCLGILDMALKLNSESIYKDGYAAGIICVDSNSTYFFILNSSNHQFIDPNLMQSIYRKIENSPIAPLAWFKITFGLNSLKSHSFWHGASQYTNLLYILDQYKKYQSDLIAIKEKEDQYRLYE